MRPIRLDARLDISQTGNSRLIVIRGAADEPRRDPDLIALVADARRWMNELASGGVASVAEITERDRKGKGAVSRILPLAYLAPDIAEAIFAGRQPAALTAKRLRSLMELPAKWSAQRAMLGFAGSPSTCRAD